MADKKSGTWVWAAAVLVVIQLVVLVGLLKLRQHDTDKSREWSLDPKAAAEEAAREKESREALGNLPLPGGNIRLTVSAAQAAAPQGEDLLDQARELQNRGQLDLAEKLLVQAQAKEPNNSRIRVASALLAESRQNSAAALQCWRELIRASEPGGTVRRLALARSHIVEERIRLEQVARQREENLAKSPRKLALAGVAEPTGEGESSRVIWKVRAVSGSGSLDPRKVIVSVSFFERGPDGVLKKSEAGLPHWEKGPPLAERDGVRNVSVETRPGVGSKYDG
ncbi:MAG: hypothetical protein NTZ01_06290, partial [Verrucomicrobia bacterium]|nr:hypothetical protein [Verrucomicrobiota bacterium]